MIGQLELDLWNALDVARSAPERADVLALCEKLDGIDLAAGGNAIAEIVNIYRSRADILLLQLSRDYLPPMEPILLDETWTHLLQQTFSFNDSHLYLEVENYYPSERRSVVKIGAEAEDVESAITEFDAALNLAHSEDIQGWSNRIRAVLPASGSIFFMELAASSGLSVVNLWMGLLLGDTGCSIRRSTGGFYDTGQIEVIVLTCSL